MSDINMGLIILLYLTRGWSSLFQFFLNNQLYLYHYTKAETAIEHILPTKKLRFSTYNLTNDPKESKDWFFIPATNQNRDLTKYNPEILGNIMNPRLKNSARLICFAKDQKLKGNHIEDLPKRGFCKPRSWAQYGNNHKGVCLIFNTQIISKIFKEKFSEITWQGGCVEYKDRLISEIQTEPAFMVNIDCLEEWGEKQYAYSHGLQFSKRLFFEKATDWANEDEYRFVVFEIEEELFLEYETALSGIVFGNDCTESHISEVVSLTKGKNVQYQQLKWRNCTPWFDFGRIQW